MLEGIHRFAVQGARSEQPGPDDEADQGDGKNSGRPQPQEPGETAEQRRWINDSLHDAFSL